jgi:hypothetical protein
MANPVVRYAKRLSIQVSLKIIPENQELKWKPVNGQY